MKWLKIFEEFQKSKYSIDDMIRCIETGGLIFTKIVKSFPDNDPNIGLEPLSIDENGVITVRLDTDIYEVNLDDVDKIEYGE